MLGPDNNPDVLERGTRPITGPLPGGYLPVFGELIREDIIYKLAIIRFWLSGRIVLTNMSFLWERPNLVWKLIPIGTRSVHRPLAQITNVTVNKTFSLKRSLWGALLVMIGFPLIVEGLFIGFLLAVVGFFLFLIVFQIRLEVHGATGSTVVTGPFIIEKKRLEDLANRLSEEITRLNR